MKLIFSLLAAISYVSVAVSNPLLATIQDIKSLNTLNSIITSSKNLTALLDTARDFTFLAPSDVALDTWFAKDPSNTPGLLATTLLKYHLLHGRFPTEAFTEEPQFAHSFLENRTYANVTGGQVVEIAKRDGQPVLSSGNKTLSSITSPPDRICTGGYLQIIDRVLELPLNLIDSLSQFGLNYFIAVLNAGGIVDQEKSPFISQLLQASDITYFAPNTPDAVKAMTEASRGVSEAQRASIARYHLVAGLYFSSDLKDGMRLKTLQGADLLVTVLNGTTYVNSAMLMTTDYLIGNGVLHTIDHLLDATKPDPPPSQKLTPVPSKVPAVEKSKSTGMSPGAQAGIVIGSLAVILLIAALVFLLSRRRKPIELAQNSGDHGQKEVAGYRPAEIANANLYRNGQRSAPRNLSSQGNSMGNANETGRYGTHRRTDTIELEANHRYNRNSLTGSQKDWEFVVNAVELDGMGSR